MGTRPACAIVRRVPRERESRPVLLLVLYAALALLFATGAQGLSHARDAFGAVLRDGCVLGSLMLAGVPVVHEGFHWLTYRVAGCRPWLGSGKQDGGKLGKIKLWVACQETVPRGVLRLELRFVPWAMSGLMVLVAALVCTETSIATGWHAIFVSALTGACMLASGWSDLRSKVFLKYPDDSGFWDDGDKYRPHRPWPARPAACSGRGA